MKPGPGAGKRAPTLIVGVGNRFRRDDGLGPAVALSLRGVRPKGVRVEVWEDGPQAVLDLPAEIRRLILIDAAASSEQGPRVHRFDVWKSTPPRNSRASSHAMGLAEALDLAKALNRLPRRTVLYAVRGRDFSHGTGLSPSARASAAACRRLILKEVLSQNSRAASPG